MGYPTSDDDPGRPPDRPPPDPSTERFRPPDERSQTAPLPQPGGFPPPGAQPSWPPPHAGPYGYGPAPGGPPPAPPRSNRGLVIALVIALVVLLAVAVALVLAWTRDTDRTASGGAGASPGVAPTSASAGPGGSGVSSSAPSSSTAPSPGDRTDELLAAVPADFPDCAASDSPGDPEVAAVDCGASTTQPGPAAASFSLYDDPARLDQAFAEDAAGVGPLPDGENCLTAQGVTTWEADGVEGGRIACTITDEGLLIAWTDREFGIEGLVTAPGTSQDELATLVGWWRADSDFQG